MIENYQFNQALQSTQDPFREIPKLKGKPNLKYLIELALQRNLDNNVQLLFPLSQSVNKNQIKICNAIYLLLDNEQRNKFLLLHRLISDSYYSPNEDVNLNTSYYDQNKRPKITYAANTTLQNKPGEVSKPVVISIDSKPGVGKSFTLVAFITTYKRPVNVYIFSHILCAPLKTHPNIQADTIASFKTKCLRLNFKSSFRYNNPYITPFDALVRLLAIIESISEDRTDSDLFYIDEYTVLEPEMLLLYYFYGLKYNKNLIFSGDSKQLNSIQTSQFHVQSNLKILEILSTESIVLEVVKRSIDVDFNKKVDKLRTLTVGCNTPLTYNIEHDIFLDHEAKFYTATDYNSTLLASRHVILTKRIRDYVNYLNENNKPHYICPYFINLKDQHNNIASFKVDETIENTKFCPFLLLVIGDVYEYIKKTNKSFIERVSVRLEQIQYQKINNHLAAFKLNVRDIDTNEMYEIERTELKESYYINNDYLKWLNENALNKTEYNKREYSVYQFPLKLTKISTFHNIQGSTISHSKIEINLEYANVEAIYVGFSRVSDYNLINKIYSRNLYSHMLTKLMNYFDGNLYYYKFGSEFADQQLIKQLIDALHCLNCNSHLNTTAAKNNILNDSNVNIFKNIKYFEADDYTKFETISRRHARIKKSHYDFVMERLKEKDDQVSSLMILTKFIKQHNKTLLEILKQKNRSIIKQPSMYLGKHSYRNIYEHYNGINKLKELFATFYKNYYPNEYANKLNFIFSDTMQLYPKFKDETRPFDFISTSNVNIDGVNKFDIIARKDDPAFDEEENEFNINDFNDEVYDFFSTYLYKKK